MIGYFTVNLDKLQRRKPSKQKKINAKNALQKIVRLNTQLFAIVQPFTEQIHQVLMGSPPVVLKAYDAPYGIPIGKTSDGFYACIDAEAIPLEKVPQKGNTTFFPVWDFDVCQYVIAVEPTRQQCEKWLKDKKLQNIFTTQEGVCVAILKGYLPQSEEAPGIVAGIAGVYYRFLPGKSVQAGLRKLLGDVGKGNPRIAILAHSPVQMLLLAKETQTTTDTIRHAQQLQQVASTGKWKEALQNDPSFAEVAYPNLLTVGALAPVASQIEADLQSLLHAEPELAQGAETIAKLLHTSLHAGLMPIAEAGFVEPPQEKEEAQTWRKYKLQSAIAAAYKYAITAQRSLFSRKLPFQILQMLQESEPAFESLFIANEKEVEQYPILREWTKAGGKIATITMSANTKTGERKTFQLLLPFAPGLFLFSTLSQPRDTLTDYEKSLVPRVLRALHTFAPSRRMPEETLQMLQDFVRTLDWTMAYKTTDAIAQTIASNAFFMQGFNMKWWQQNPTPQKEKLRILQHATSWPRAFYDVAFLAELAGNMLAYGADKPDNQQIVALMTLAPIMQFFRFEQADKHIPKEWASHPQGYLFSENAWQTLQENIKGKTPEESLQTLALAIAPKLQSIGVEAVFAQVKTPSGKWKAFYYLPRGNIGVYEKEGKVFASAKTDTAKLYRFYQRDIEQPANEKESVIAYIDVRKVKPFPSVALQMVPAEKMPFPPSAPATFAAKYQSSQKPEDWQDVLNSPFATQLPAVVANLVSLFKNWESIFQKIAQNA